MKYKCLIFDMDGCLINSNEVQKLSLKLAYDEVVGDDKQPTFEEYNKYTGDSLSNIFIKLGLPLTMVEPYRRYSKNLLTLNYIDPLLISLIKEWRSQDIKIAICTGKERDRVIQILEYFNITDLFDAIVCSDDVSRPKPYPDSILKCLEILNIKKEDALYLGDGNYDGIASNAAGVDFALTTWYSKIDITVTPKYIFSSMEELKRIP